MRELDVNGARFREGDAEGHYESWFQRANHPTRPLAFWIRYTILSRKGDPRGAVGELWALFFDGERRRVTAVREEHPLAECAFSARGLEVRIATATLSEGELAGAASQGGRSVRWGLRWTGGSTPLLLFPRPLYDARLPRAKVLTGAPLARFDGSLEVGGERIDVDGWVGSQNHNWGSRHTDRYAWGQVAGFDGAPGAFLELATARVRVGPVLTPALTVAVLRVDGEEHRFDSIARGVIARASHRPFEWTFRVSRGDETLEGRMSAPPWAFVALPYGNPPGGTKTCLNSKLARCEVRLSRRGRAPIAWSTYDRAAFEMLSDDPAPLGVASLE